MLWCENPVFLSPEAALICACGVWLTAHLRGVVDSNASQRVLEI